jgi:hypothetical protein
MRPASRIIYVYATMISYLASYMKMWKMHTSVIEIELDTTSISCDGWFGVESFRSAGCRGRGSSVGTEKVRVEL